MQIPIENNLTTFSSTQKSYLANNLGTAGAGTIHLKNISGFENQYAIQIGQTGQEQAEIFIGGNPSGSAIPLNSGTLKFDHPQDTPVFQIHYDKVIVKRSTSGTAGTASSIATVSITPDSPFTVYNDTSGAATYAYKIQYYNSVSADLSSESDWFTPGGPSFYSLQKLRDRIKGRLNDAGFIKKDSIIDDWINEWVEQMTNEAIKVDKGYSLGTAAYAFGTAGLGTITASLFKHANKIELTWDGVNYVNSREIPINSFSDSDTFASSAAKHYWQGDTVFGIKPNGQAGTARFTLSQLFTPMADDSDELPQFLRAYTTGCVEYGLYCAQGQDEKDPIAQGHYAKFMTQQNKFVNQITPRDQTGIKMIDFVEDIAEYDYDYL
jgi:hypothetical protein